MRVRIFDMLEFPLAFLFLRLLLDRRRRVRFQERSAACVRCRDNLEFWGPVEYQLGITHGFTPIHDLFGPSQRYPTGHRTVLKSCPIRVGKEL